MASIELKCYATLNKYQPEGGRADVSPGESLGEMADRLSIPREHVHIKFVNGNHSDWNAPLNNGDRVGLFPAVGGG